MHAPADCSACALQLQRFPQLCEWPHLVAIRLADAAQRVPPRRQPLHRRVRCQQAPIKHADGSDNQYGDVPPPSGKRCEGGVRRCCHGGPAGACEPHVVAHPQRPGHLRGPAGGSGMRWRAQESACWVDGPCYTWMDVPEAPWPALAAGSPPAPAARRCRGFWPDPPASYSTRSGARWRAGGQQHLRH